MYMCAAECGGGDFIRGREEAFCILHEGGGEMMRVHGTSDLELIRGVVSVSVFCLLF